MVIDTVRYARLLVAAHDAVEQMDKSNNFIMKLLRVYGPSQPLYEAMQELAAAVADVEKSLEIYKEVESEHQARDASLRAAHTCAAAAPATQAE